MDQIFFQSSLPRSGSTLLQNILAQNPEIYTTPTSPLVDYVSFLREVYTNNPNVLAQNENQMKVAFQRMCKFTINGYFDALTDRKYVVDKSRSWIPNYDFLTFIIGDKPKVICMVRDLRDVFSSNEKNFRRNPDKARANFGLGNANTLPKRIDAWAASNNFLGASIEFLDDSIKTGIIEDMLIIKYEDLCLFPEKQLEMVYKYLDVPFYNHDFDNVPQTTHENDKVHGIFGVHTIRNTVEMIPSDAKQLLGVGVCDWIYNRYKWFFEYFNYKY